MPLLEVTQTRYVSASIRLTDSTALQLDQYAAFIHASADEVMEQALAMSSRKTATSRSSFALLKPNESRRHCACVACKLPTRRSIPRRSLLPRLLRLPQHQQLLRYRKHDPRLQGWQDHYGAAHRKNLDTPSLVGSCRCTTVHLLRPQ